MIVAWVGFFVVYSRSYSADNWVNGSKCIQRYVGDHNEAIWGWMPLSFIFVQDSDPKNTARGVQVWSLQKIQIFRSPHSKSWHKLNRESLGRCREKKQQKNVYDLHQNIRQNISFKRCQDLVASLTKRFNKILKHRISNKV